MINDSVAGMINAAPAPATPRETMTIKGSDSTGRYQRCGCEYGQTDQHRAASAVAVTQRAGRQQQTREDQGVAVHDPGELGLGGRGRDRDVGERGVQRHHRGDHQQHAEARDREQPEPGPF